MSLDPAADLASGFDDLAAGMGAKPAVRESDRQHPYADLMAWSLEITAALAPLCRLPGQRVGLMMPNSAAFVAAFFAIARAGGVVAPLNVRYRTQELLYYLEDTRARALIVPGELVEPAREALGRLPDPPALIRVDDAEPCRVIAEGRGEAAAAAGGDSRPLLQQYTSGSTGKPKRVVKTHAQLAFELERLVKVFDLGSADRFLGAAPFTHVNGLVRTMMTSMFVGGRSTRCATFAAARCWISSPASASPISGRCRRCS